LRRDDIEGAFNAAELKWVAIVTLGKPRAATGDESSFAWEIAVEVFDAVKRRLCDFAAEVIRQDSTDRLHILHDEIRDGLLIAQAVRMMPSAVFDHHGNASTQPLIDALEDRRVLSQDRVDTS